MENYYALRSGFLNISLISGNQLTEEGVVSLLSVLGSSVSLVGLVFSFITYSLFSDWRNLSGTALMNLLASLFMVQLLYVIVIGGVQDKELCIGLIFGVQYIRMTVWMWLLVMIRNAYKSFSNSLSLLTPIDPKLKETFWKSSVIGWFSPALLLAVAIVLERSDTDGFADVDRLKKTNCFLLTGHAFTFAFLVPTVLVFAAVLRYIWKTFVVIKKNVCIQHSRKAVEKINGRRMLQLSLLIKITVIVSSVNFFAITYALTENEIVWFVFNVLQGLEGILVALCVTCDCQVLKMYTRPLRRVKQRRGSYEGILNSDLSISTSLQVLSLDPNPDIVNNPQRAYNNDRSEQWFQQ